MGDGDYVRINLSEADLLDDYERCSHVMLYAKTDKLSVVNSSRKATVMMQMRFDGHLGFPGGLVEDGETPFEGANRECLEEINWPGTLTADDLLFIHVRKSVRQVNYFFQKEFNHDELMQIIEKSVVSEDFGYESLGSVIVPLYTMEDAFRGLPAFLTNSFVGNARAQLTEGLIALKLLSEDDVLKALKAKNTKNV